MVKTINFDDHCIYWSKNYMISKTYVEHQIGYIYDIIRYQGYIYLEEIYKLFGAGWNPRESNDVMIFGENDPVVSYKHLGGSDFSISICY